MSNYYEKYLKYKSKYLQLKNQIGGAEYDSYAALKKDYPNIDTWTVQGDRGSKRFDIVLSGKGSKRFDIVLRAPDYATSYLHCSRYRETDKWHCSNNPPATDFQQERNKIYNNAEKSASNWKMFTKKSGEK